jgi:hypothetical protein
MGAGIVPPKLPVFDSNAKCVEWVVLLACGVSFSRPSLSLCLLDMYKDKLCELKILIRLR